MHTAPSWPSHSNMSGRVELVTVACYSRNAPRRLKGLEAHATIGDDNNSLQAPVPIFAAAGDGEENALDS